MPMTTAYLNVVAGAGRTAITHVSLANGTAQANELAVTRQSITWNTAVNGAIDSSNAPVFSVPAGSTVNNVQFWSAATGGTYYGNAPVAAETFSGAGTYTVSDADILHNAS